MEHTTENTPKQGLSAMGLGPSYKRNLPLGPQKPSFRTFSTGSTAGGEPWVTTPPTLEANLFEPHGDRPPANEGNLPTPMFHVEHPSTTNVKRPGGVDPVRGPSQCSTWNTVLARSLPQQAGAKGDDLPSGGASSPLSRNCAAWECSTWNTHPPTTSNG